MEATEELRKQQEKHRKQMKDNREKVMERKRRAHRLIVRGAIAEALIEGAAGISDEEFKERLYGLAGRTGTLTPPHDESSRQGAPSLRRSDV